MKTRPFAATAGLVAVVLLNAVAVHAADTGPRRQSGDRAADRSNAPLAASSIPDAVLLAAAVAARKDSDPELNGAIRDLRPAPASAERR